VLELPPELIEIRDRHTPVFAIVSPPRCSSTAFARVFWEQPSIGFYCHEPFEVTYYLQRDLDEVVEKLNNPLELEGLVRAGSGGRGHSLLIKEMPYQVGERFPLLAALATKPIVFLMRDPRLNIASRMAKKREVGESEVFPQVESGWELWYNQIKWCSDNDVEHILVDSTDFRNEPLETFPQVFDRFGLSFSPEMLEWRACPDVELDNLGGRHRHLYGEVLESKGIKPDRAEIPALDFFPEENGLRAHVEVCLAFYREMAESDARIRPQANPAVAGT
jgi:hypothetical protein